MRQDKGAIVNTETITLPSLDGVTITADVYKIDIDPLHYFYATKRAIAEQNIRLRHHN
ncbi:hypothetical protein N7U66_08010 [Lacinutrix neustonica]|uniref:Uncharacterized protein n=1 Tax=Lacinutrix neustonica TaxID=2980107 RepID=A0A9E8SED5_9FLAO|nr:hypothetical protein [Lacinutrix neustonica]WAC03438.1 hypothetical protein N7U66_08010 [Lacinutrix neustonica]